MTADRLSVNPRQERILLVAARAGDELAFGRLASRYRPGLGLFCRLMLGCPRAADVCLEDVETTDEPGGPPPFDGVRDANER
jgi:hypothetical protein